jgi:hypothetical protein
MESHQIHVPNHQPGKDYSWAGDQEIQMKKCFFFAMKKH